MKGLKLLVIRGALSSFIAQGIGMAANIILIGYLVQVFGKTYGALIAGTSIISMVSMLELGLGLFVIREVSIMAESRADPRAWKKAFSMMSWTFLLAGLIMGLIAVPLVRPIMHGLHLYEDGDNVHLQNALWGAAIQLGLTFPLGIFQFIVQGLNKLEYLGWLAITNTLVTASSTFFLTQLWSVPEMIPVGAIMGSAVSGVLAVSFIPKPIRSNLWTIPSFDLDVWKRIDNYCRPFIMGKMFFMIKERTDEPLAARYAGTESVVVYTSTVRLVRMAMTVLPTIGNMVFAPSSALLASGETGRLKAATVKMVEAGLSFGVVAAGLIWVFNAPFISLWVGTRWFGGNILTWVFCGWLIVDSVQRLVNPIILAAGKTNRVARYVGIEAVLNIVLSFILVRYYGIVGIALGTLISMIVGSAWLIPRTAFEIVNLSWRELAMELKTPVWRLIIVGAGFGIIKFLAGPMESVFHMALTLIGIIGLLVGVYFGVIKSNVRTFQESLSK